MSASMSKVAILYKTKPLAKAIFEQALKTFVGPLEKLVHNSQYKTVSILQKCFFKKLSKQNNGFLTITSLTRPFLISYLILVQYNSSFPFALTYNPKAS